MKKAIIHISDLHVTSHLDPDGIPIKSEINSYFNTNLSDETGNSFLQSITDFIGKTYLDTELFLIVTGDITEAGKKDEFTEASRIIKQFIEALSIDKNKILLVPGDHDVNRNDCSLALEKNIVKDRSEEHTS